MTATADPVFRWCAAKYTIGVVTRPTSITSAPLACMPFASACASEGPDSRPS